MLKPIDKETKAKLRENSENISQNLRNMPEVLANLYSKHTILDGEKSRIDAEETDFAKARKILDYIQKGTYREIQVLREVFSDTDNGHLNEYLPKLDF